MKLFEITHSVIQCQKSLGDNNEHKRPRHARQRDTGETEKSAGTKYKQKQLRPELTAFKLSSKLRYYEARG